MTPARSHARVVVRARDPRLRSLIAERLSAPGDLDVEQEGAQADGRAHPPGSETALVEVVEKPALTRREAEVLELLAQGMANKEIAFRLGISAHTAKFHVESLLRKFDAANRAEVVREGIRQGLIGV